MNNLNLVLALFGGWPGIIANLVSSLTKNKVNLTAVGIDTAADRMFTVSEKDNSAACARLGIKDPADVQHALGLARIAGDKMGDYAAFLAEKGAHITHADGN